MLEAFLVNPLRRKRRVRRAGRKRGRRGRRALMAVAPVGPVLKRRKKRGRVLGRKLTRQRIRVKGRKHRPVLYEVRPDYWERSPFSVSKRLGVRINPLGEEVMVVGLNPRRRRRRRYRRLKHNPPVSLSVRGIGNLAVPVLAGVASKLVVERIPQYTGWVSGIPKYGSQLVVAIGGGWAISKYVSSTAGYAWAIVGTAVVVSDIISSYLFSSPAVTSGIGQEFPEYEIGAFPTETEVGEPYGVGAYPYEYAY